MRPFLITVFLVIGAFADIAMGEVTDAREGGFSLTHEVTVDAARADAWQAAVYSVARGHGGSQSCCWQS